MGKLSTPAWILEGYDSPAAYEKAKGTKAGKSKKASGKTYKVRRCPKCKSQNVGVVLGNEEGKGAGEWECHKCKWKGKDIEEVEMNEDEFIKSFGEADDEK